MRRILVYILLFSACCNVFAQEKYEELLAQTQQLPRYVALFQLLQYQQAHPQFHAVYYQLGEIQTSLIHEYHPIRNYSELHDCLYRAQVYYGNCTYYAKGETLKASYYPTIPTAARNIEYDQLNNLAIAKRDSVKRLQQEADTLYARYHRMVDHYDMCRTLFTNFCMSYPGEKNAHLTLSDSSRLVLEKLIYKYEQFKQDLKSYQQVQDHAIDVQQAGIILYRLDGLTPVDFLQERTTIWNYGDWAKHFLDEQNTTYRTYFNDIEKSFANVDPVLLNRIDRMDFQSFMIPLLRLYGMESLYEETMSLDSLYEQFTYLERAPKDAELVRTQVSPEDIGKYKDILLQHQMTDVESVILQAKLQMEKLNTLYTQISAHFAKNVMSDSSAKDDVLYEDDVLELRITRDKLPQQWQQDAISIIPYEKSLIAVVLPERVEFVPLSKVLLKED